MYKAEPCKICGQSIKLYDCEKCYGLCSKDAEKDCKKDKCKFSKEKNSTNK
ncbi:MAG: hypothetical protein ACRCW2_16485 [Cellulosilyticaceae bacterium]